jgi:uncharacterized protein YbjT (DUF2867 family)
MRIAILGSTGQLGRIIVQQLKNDHPDADVIACSRNERRDHFLFRPFDDNWDKLGKIDVLINAIGIIEETSDLSFQKAHQGLTKLIIANREFIGNPRVIQLSVLGADEKSPSSFLSTKGKADKELLSHKNTLIIRPSIVCTPGTMIVQKMLSLRKITNWTAGLLPIPSGIINTKIQPVMGEDVAAIVSGQCTQESTGIIEVVGPDCFAVKELILKASPKTRMLPINNALSGIFISIAAKVFPKLINKSQYGLLFYDNIGDRSKTESYLGRPLMSTMNFWKEEFR